MDYFSRCPGCQTVHQLSLADLNLTQGRVRCAHCQHKFDAYQCFVLIESESQTNDASQSSATSQIYSECLQHDLPIYASSPKKSENAAQQYVSQLLAQRCSDSGLSLRQYLNYMECLAPLYQNEDK